VVLTGILSPGEAFVGFSHPAVISVAAVVVLSAGVERTGVFGWMAQISFAARRFRMEDGPRHHGRDHGALSLINKYRGGRHLLAPS
jgi:hypothetical protein